LRRESVRVVENALESRISQARPQLTQEHPLDPRCGVAGGRLRCVLIFEIKALSSPAGGARGGRAEFRRSLNSDYCASRRMAGASLGALA
jgi:hypothetical protein